MKQKIAVLFWAFITCLPMSLNAQGKVEMSNASMKVLVVDNEVRLLSNKTSLKVKRLVIPGNITKIDKGESTDALFGKAQQISLQYDNGRSVTLKLYPDNPFLYIHTSIINDANEDVSIRKLDFACVDVDLASSKTALNTLGSGGLRPMHKAQGSFTYLMLSDPKSYHSLLMAWMTQLRGIGTMMPKYDKARQVCSINAGLEFGNLLVRQGCERNTDTMVVGFFEDGRDGLEKYADHLVKVYDIKLQPKPEVYCTWYHRKLTGSGASNEKLLQENALFVEENLKDFGLNTFQIDDQWQSAMVIGGKKQKDIPLGNGPITNYFTTNQNYKSGMDAAARKLNDLGITAGIWFMPFSADANSPYCNSKIFARRLGSGLPYTAKKWSGTCIDASGPYGEAFLRDRFSRIYNWGYRYMKIDGLHTGAPSENVYVQRAYNGGLIFGEAEIANPDMTFVECFRRGMSILNEEAPKAFLLGCSATQNMSSFAGAFGMVDAMRVGPDNDAALAGWWKAVTLGADYAGNLYFLHNKVWYNDPDPFYIRETNPLNKARWMASWQAVSGAMNTTSMQYSQLSPERLDLLKRALPSHTLNARPVDILESAKPQIWCVNNERMHVVGLFNWSEEKSTTISYPFGRMGLDASQTYDVFDFWANEYVGKMSARMQSGLDPAGCRVLAMREEKPYPQVISTSRHITQGLMDIVGEDWDAKEKTLTVTSKVVKKDAYELRIVVPETFVAKQAICKGKKLQLMKTGNLLRVVYQPDKTEQVAIRISFE